MTIQPQLFTDSEMEQAPKPKASRRGGSSNPIVFHDYEGFVAKFADKPKTTDDCYAVNGTDSEAFKTMKFPQSVTACCEPRRAVNPSWPNFSWQMVYLASSTLSIAGA